MPIKNGMILIPVTVCILGSTSHHHQFCDINDNRTHFWSLGGCGLLWHLQALFILSRAHTHSATWTLVLNSECYRKKDQFIFNF